MTSTDLYTGWAADPEEQRPNGTDLSLCSNHKWLGDDVVPDYICSNIKLQDNNSMVGKLTHIYNITYRYYIIFTLENVL